MGEFLPPRGLLCSRHNPAFLQRTGSGSHLYSANLHTLRSGHGAEVLLTLVGLSLWDCLALSFCTLIVSYFKGFVKRFFELFSFGREILFYFTQLRIGERLFAPVCLFCTLIVSYFGGFVKGFFTFFFEPAGLVIDPLPQVLSWEGLYSLSP